MLLVFASDAKGPAEIAKPCGRWYSDRRVSCLILSHSKFEKGQTALKAPAERVTFCSGSLLGEQMTGCGKWDSESLRRPAKLAKLM